MDAVRVPARDGEVLALPPLSEYEGWMDANRLEAEGWTFSFAGVSAAAWRREARQGLHALRGLLVSGHQPELLHPGAWMKSFVLDVFAMRGLTAVELVVDSDVPSQRSIVLPTMRQGLLEVAHVDIPGMVQGRPWERQPPLRREAWKQLLDAAEEALATLPTRLPLERARRFRDLVMKASWVDQTGCLAESLPWARRLWDTCAVTEVHVSRLSQGLPFAVFVMGVLERLAEFHEAYNGALAEHRHRRRIRSTANPVPSLRRVDELWEMPFWYLHEGGERTPLFARRSREGWVLVSGGRDLLRLEGWPKAWVAPFVAWQARTAHSGVRPRALSLTAFARLALADLFVHGAGGARYDRVTDLLIERWLGIRSPRYTVASYTRWLDLPALDLDLGLERARRELRDLQWNPQRHGAVGTLAKRKEELLAELREAPRGRRARLTAAVRELNERMLAGLAGEKERLEARLALARRRAAVLCRRDYPFFLFEPSEMRAVAASLLPRA